MGVIIKKLKVREKRDRGLRNIIKVVAPAVKAWYDRSVIQFLKNHENELTEENEALILSLSDYLEGKLDDPNNIL